MTFVGFDLHKRYITACALDDEGAVVAECRQLTTAIGTVLDWLAALPAPVTVAMEATLYWEWLATQLEAHGIAARVAHAFHVKLIWQTRSKTDPIDARKLAELLRVNLLPTIWLPDVATRQRRQLLRGRAFLVRERTRVRNRIHGHLTTENLLVPKTDLYGTGGRAWLAAAPLSPTLRTQTDRLLRVHDVLTAEIQSLDHDVKRAARSDPIARQLSTIPGVGVFGSLFLQAEIGPIGRFRSSHELAAYAGLVPTTRSSGGKTTHGGLGKASNRWLKWILVEIVVSLKLAPGPVSAYYRHLLRAKGKPKATTAAARKLCCYIYWMLKEGWTYEEWLRQHEAQRPNAQPNYRRSEVRPVQRLGVVA
jgi:transposase